MVEKIQTNSDAAALAGTDFTYGSPDKMYIFNRLKIRMNKKLIVSAAINGMSTNIIYTDRHGGSGFTLAFGCAEEVRDILADGM